MQVENKRFLITGATSGMGKAIAESFLENGMKGILIGRNKQVLNEFKSKFGDQTEIHTLCVDLKKRDQLYSFIKFVEKNNLDIDYVVHSAGFFDMCPIVETTDEMLEGSFDINFRVPFILTRELIPNLSKTKGQFIFINSTSASLYKANKAIYSSFKAALKMFAETLFHEVNSLGVKVTSIYPGRVATPMQERIRELEKLPYKPDEYMSVESLAAMVLKLINLPEDVEIRHLTIRPPLKG